jgi:hypothetical protein
MDLELLLLLLRTVLFLQVVILDDIVIDEFRIIDKKPRHLLLKELRPPPIMFLFITERRLIVKIRALAIIRLEFLLRGSNVVLAYHVFDFYRIVHVDFHYSY